MRRRIEALADRMEEFVSEDGHDALVVELRGDGAAGLVGAALDLVTQRDGVDVVFPFLVPFRSARDLEDAALAWTTRFAHEEELVLTENAAPLASAIDALCALARALDDRDRARLVVLLCPTRIEAEAAYLETALALVGSARRVDPPLRIVVADTPERRLRATLAHAAIPALEAAMDVSPEAVREALAEEANDPANDRSVRAAALLVATMSDVAAGRAADALPVLVALADGFASIGDGSSRALAVIAAGNALWQLGRLEEARACLSRGLAIALEAHAAPVVLSGAMQAGSLAMRLGDAADADARFDVAARLAAMLGSPHALAEALFERGHALEARTRIDEACSVWTRAADAARLAGAVERERAALDELLRVRAECDHLEVSSLEQRRAALESMPHACTHGHGP
jgi:tetratricopeptide (TPR) repeat protein